MRRVRGGIPLLAALLALAGSLGGGVVALPGGGRVAILVDDSPSCEAPEECPEEARRFRTSDLASEMRVAAAGGATRLLLLTDGCDTGAGEPATAGIPTDVRLLARRDDVGILSVQTPPRIAAGTPFLVEVTVGRTAGPSRPPVACDVVLLREGQRIGGGQRVMLGRGQRRTLRFPDHVAEEGPVRYRASVLGAPGDPANDDIEAIARVGDRPAILAIGVAPPEGFLGRQVSSAEAAEALAASGAERALDAVLLAAPDLPPAAQERLASLVREGAGLLVLGGGGFSGEPLESILPLTDVPPGGRSVCLLLDFSGSMEPLRGDLAEAVARLKGLLSGDDWIAVVGFRGDVFLPGRWTRVREERTDLRALAATGNTYLLPALERAAALLGEAPAPQRRLYVVSDGRWHDAASPELSRRLTGIEAVGVHATAVFVGEAEPPRLFQNSSKATEVSALRDALRRAEEGAPDRKLRGPLPSRPGLPPPWLDLAWPREWAEVERLYPRNAGERIAVFAGEAPALATLEPGGRVAVLAGPGPAVGDLLRAVVRPRSPEGVTLRALREGRDIVVVASGGSPGEFVMGDRRVLARPTGPGTWSACFPEAGGAARRIRFQGAEAWVGAAPAHELEGLTSRADIAASIARRSGGRFFDSGTLFPAPTEERRTKIWATLLLAAACVVGGAFLRRDG